MSDCAIWQGGGGSDLVGIKNAKDLVSRDRQSVGVELCADVVDVPTLPVHLALGPLAAGDVDEFRPLAVNPGPLLRILPVVAPGGRVRRSLNFDFKTQSFITKVRSEMRSDGQGRFKMASEVFCIPWYFREHKNQVEQ